MVMKNLLSGMKLARCLGNSQVQGQSRKMNAAYGDRTCFVDSFSLIPFVVVSNRNGGNPSSLCCVLFVIIKEQTNS